MIIQFQHQNKDCSAYVIPPLFSPSNTIVVYMLDCNGDLGYHVIFILTKENEWKTNAGIKTKFPLSYLSLCNKLSEIFTAGIFEGVSFKFEKEMQEGNQKSIFLL